MEPKTSEAPAGAVGSSDPAGLLPAAHPKTGWRRFVTWKTTLATLAVLVIVVLASIGGYLLVQSQGYYSQTAQNTQTTPSATPSSPATKTTPTPTTVSSHFSGKVLFRQTSGDISMANPDGSQISTVISGNNTGFAGVDATSTHLYYIQADASKVIFTLHQRSLGDGQDKTLATFTNTFYIDTTGDDKYTAYDSLAKVSPDGKYALVATYKGIDRIDLSNGSAKTLLTNTSCNPEQSYSLFNELLSWLVQPVRAAFDCQTYQSPRYTADGSKALVTVGHYEGSSSIVINAQTGQTIVDLGGGAAAFNPNGDRLLKYGTGYTGPGSLLYYATFNTQPIDLVTDKPGFGEPDVYAAAWSPDNRILVANYSPDGDTFNTYKLWLSDPQDQSLTPINTNVPTELGSEMLWLSDGVNVLTTAYGHHMYQLDTKASLFSVWAENVINPIAVMP